MSTICPVCQTTIPDGQRDCLNCGYMLGDADSLYIPGASAGDPTPAPEASEAESGPSEPGQGARSAPAATEPSTTIEPAWDTGIHSFEPAAASLRLKRLGAVTAETIPLHGSRMVVGRFDASAGPVDIDLSSLPGSEAISRRHAELYVEAGAWHVKDLGATNGVFVKRSGSAQFEPRLQSPTRLSDGDELAFGNIAFVFRTDG